MFTKMGAINIYMKDWKKNSTDEMTEHLPHQMENQI